MNNAMEESVGVERLRPVEERCTNLQERANSVDALLEHIQERETACQEQLTTVEREITRTTHLAAQLRIDGQRIMGMSADLRHIYGEAVGRVRQNGALVEPVITRLPDEEVLDVAVLTALNFKQCPNCAVHTEKNGGCDHMVSLFRLFQPVLFLIQKFRLAGSVNITGVGKLRVLCDQQVLLEITQFLPHIFTFNNCN
jgi:hypothetical protein